MRVSVCGLGATIALALLAPAPAGAAFGLNGLEVSFDDAKGAPTMQAGSHPFSMRTSFGINELEEGGGFYTDGAVRDLRFLQAEGFAGDPRAVPRCANLDFLTVDDFIPNCANSTAVGFVSLILSIQGEKKEVGPFAVYNLEPSPGVAAKLGFWTQDVPQTIDVGVNPDPPYNVVASLANVSQTLEVLGSNFVLWGNPADSAHDELRGSCIREGGSCPAAIPVRPFLTLPRRCTGPLVFRAEATSWWSGFRLEPGPPTSDEESAPTKDPLGNPLGTHGCAALPFDPDFQAAPTTQRAESPSGLGLAVDISDPGLANPSGVAHSDITKAVLALPEGMTANPSQAEGLAVCTEDQFAKETAVSAFGAGCPAAAKIGTVEVETPLLEGELLSGSLFVAEPYENRFGTLLALFMTIKHPELGIGVRLASKVEADPSTGQLTTTLEDIPELPVSHFRVRLREGGRSPLISPPSCGPHEIELELSPSGDRGNPLTLTSVFEISQGVAGGSCPPGGPRPFAPGFVAGTTNNTAGAHSPFHLRLTRRDGDQDMTRFDATLPAGLVAKLAGVTRCPQAAIAAAKESTGRQELAAPSCPLSSRIGSVLAGAGVGSQLTYVPGSIYLAGSFGGAPLSVAAIVPAVAGPFDVGTVVAQQALGVHPRTAEVRIDGAASDPIPHILAGIPLRVRDIRVDVDRPQFTLNPTSCDPMSIGASIWGGGSNLFSTADDAPFARSVPFQAASCLNLGFRPRLDLRLKGSNKRGGFPALRASYRPRPGDANLADLIVRLPRSVFLEQAHIGTICTRVQFAAEACPAASRYGELSVWTPILEEPLRGPVYLRSSDNDLPDLVFDLHGLVDLEVVTRIDSVRGGIRATLESAPDAPISLAVLRMQGGKKGLIVNSRDLCTAPSRARVQLDAQSGKRISWQAPVRPSGCAKQRRTGRGRGGGRGS